jgi:hypothetical protein
MTAMNKTFTSLLLDMMPSCHNNLFDSPLWMSVHTTILPLPWRAHFLFCHPVLTLLHGAGVYDAILFLVFSFCLFFCCHLHQGFVHAAML